MDDKQIVDLYWERSEEAIKETDKKYGRYCHYIAYRILGSDEDAKEVQNDTYLRVWNTVPPKRPDFLKAYVGTISRNFSLNRYESMRAQKRGGQVDVLLCELNDCVADNSEDEAEENQALCEALNRFLASLPRKTRRIFLCRYWYASDIAEIASEYAMSENAVSVLLYRTRQKLKKILEEEGLL